MHYQINEVQTLYYMIEIHVKNITAPKEGFILYHMHVKTSCMKKYYTISL